MKKTAIIYGSSTDNTRSAAELIEKGIDAEEVKLMDIADVEVADLQDYDNLIIGTSTWGMGDLQDDWDEKVEMLEELDLSGKVVALFGMGDSGAYPDTFVDGMGTLYEALKGRGGKMVGAVATDGYTFDESTAVVDNKFVGLALDEDNESDLTEERIENWLNNLRSEWL